MKNLFKINTFTYIIFILSFLSGYYKEMFITYFILVVHELGHFFLMKINNIKVKNITMYPYGGMIKSNMLINTNSIKVLLISLGGIINQIILYLLFFILFKLNIIDQNIYKICINYNTYIIIFNLLPIYPLDGFKILNSILEIFLSFKKGLIISLIINFISLIIFIIYLYIYKINNYIIILFLITNILKYIKEIKYIFNKFYIERIIYKIDYKGLKSVNKISEIYKNKFNYIKSIDEKVYIETMFRK